MPFESARYRQEFVIDDHSSQDLEAPPTGMSKGLELGRRSTGYGRMLGAPAFPSNRVIPRNEWKDRIEEQERLGSRLSQKILEVAKLPSMDQNGTNYCWGNGPVGAYEAKRIQQNQTIVRLSAASICAPIKNFRNEGGWGEEALAKMVTDGVVPVKYWPANAIDRRYLTEENRIRALEFRVPNWWELIPRDLDQMISCLLQFEPIAIGLNWWRHEVYAVEAVWVNGKIGIRCRNSWTDSYGQNGFFILQDSKMLADDAVVPRDATPSSSLAA